MPRHMRIRRRTTAVSKIRSSDTVVRALQSVLDDGWTQRGIWFWERRTSCLMERYSAASRARSLCIRLKTFSEIWRDRSGAAYSHIDGGDAEVASWFTC